MTKQQDQIDIAVIKSSLQDIKDDVREIKEKLEKDYVTRQEFDAKFNPIQKLIFGVIGTLITSIVIAGIAFFSKK